MAKNPITFDIDDEDRAVLLDRVRHDISLGSQLREAVKEYLAHGTHRDREDEQVRGAQGAAGAGPR